MSDFILTHMEAILAEWVAYAHSLDVAVELDTEALRDHAEAILRAIANDMAQPQTLEQSKTKSKGHAPHAKGGDTAAEEHGEGRHAEGFTMVDMVSEYRAVRASVVRMWIREMGSADRATLEELARFDEAIDQAMAESIARFNERLDRSRELFIGVLGHDLRSPLGAMMMSAEYLMRTGGLSGQQLKAVTAIARGGERIRGMIADLLDVTRTRLGEKLPITRRPVDLGLVCQQVVDQGSAHHPSRTITFDSTGDLRGCWDEIRIAQLVGNLMENAVQHGAADRPLTVRAISRGGDAVELSVHNAGKPIPEAIRPRIFEPMTQAEANARGGSMGLGLYIARAIVDAHGGSISVESSAAAGTTFKVHLPRSPEHYAS